MAVPSENSDTSISPEIPNRTNIASTPFGYAFAEINNKIDSLKADISGITFGGGQGGGSNMEARIAVLEHQARTAEERMGRVEDKLDRLLEAVTKLPSTNAMWTMIATVVGICAASVGVIVAILTWLQGFHH